MRLFGARALLGMLAAVAMRPGMWPTAVAEVFLLAQPGWWRHWPPVPLPAPAYVRFRVQTAYGDAPGQLNAAELIDYLKWCRRMRRLG